MKKKALALILVLTMIMMLSNTLFAAETTTAAETWQVSVGKETAATSLDSMFPKVLFIHEGDKVVFNNGSTFTPHTVTFLAGQKPITPADSTYAVPTAPSGVNWDGKTLLNSGMMLPSDTYEVTFSSSGAYSYYCILHPMMTGTIVVIPKGQPIPSKVEQIAAAKAEENELLLQESMIAGSAEAKFTSNKDGSLTYAVDLGTMNSTFSHNRMIPETIIVSEGDSILWDNRSPYEMHWVTFNKPADMEFSIEGFAPPSGGKEFAGEQSGFINSGMMMSTQSYELKFTKAGSYEYECYLHSGSLMKGTVVVVPKGAIKLTVNGQAVPNSASAYWKDGDLKVGLVALTKALNGKFAQDKKSKAYTLTVNGKTIHTTGYVLKGTTYVSAETIVRALGGVYSWNEATKAFAITISASTTAATAATAAPAEHMH